MLQQCLVVWLVCSILIAAQSSTITAPPSSATPGSLAYLTCYSSNAGDCLDASFIQGSCLSAYTFIDDILSCECVNNYPSAWSKCRDCLTSHGGTYGVEDSTEVQIASCGYVLSVLAEPASTSAVITSGENTTSRGATAPLTASTASASPSIMSGTSRNGAPVRMMQDARYFEFFSLLLAFVIGV